LTRYQGFAAFLLFVCLAAYALGANPFAKETVAPFDWLVEFPGWWAVPSDRDALFRGQSDILNSQIPAWITLKEQIRTGKGALWYPNIAGGAPVSFELCNPAFLVFLMVKDNALAYYLAGLMKLAIAGFGAYLFLRVFLGWLSSVWGGIVFMLCGFNAAWFFWDQVTTAIWIPWLLWSTVMYLTTESRRWLPAITITALLLIFGSFPSVGAFGFYAFALLLLFWNGSSYLSAKRKGVRDRQTLRQMTVNTVLPLLSVGIAFIMAAITLIPFMDSMSGVNLGYRVGIGTPFRIHEMANLITYAKPIRIETAAYVGIIACILSAAGMVPVFRKDTGPLKKFALFNAVLVILTLLITFGLLPHGLISALPVFKNNSWGRLIVVTLLGISALSAVGLDYLSEKTGDLLARNQHITPSTAHKIVVLSVITLMTVQFHSQKGFFNSVNAVVPSAWFFPETPSITYVKERLSPLESVIADESFIGAGTLGAYGIGEWYAHSFKTDKEKEVLGSLVDDAFVTPTAAIIKGDKIRYFSPLMDMLAIKYLLLNKKVIEREQTFDLPGAVVGIAPPLPDNAWNQHLFMPTGMTVGYIGLVFDTYGEEHPATNVRLAVYDAEGRLYAESELSRHRVADKKWGFFKFPKVYFEKGEYSLVLSLADQKGAAQLSAMVTPAQEQEGRYLDINGARSGASLKMKIAAYERVDLKAFEKKWNVIDLESDTVIFENKEVKKGAYFVDTLDPAKDRPDFSGIDIEQPSSDLIRITYSKGEKGWIVLPMHLHSGWKAFVNDNQVNYDTYLGILPAIPVNGASRVEFRYQPASFRRGVMVSLTGFFIFLILSGVCCKIDKKRDVIP